MAPLEQSPTLNSPSTEATEAVSEETSSRLFDNLMEVMAGRRSIRLFDTTKVVSKEILLKAVEAAQWAPSACNKQAWEFIVLNDKNVRQRIADSAADPQSHSMFVETPAIIYCLYDNTISPEKHSYIQSACAAIQNVLLALHALGLGACWYSDLDDELIRSYYKIPEDKDLIGALRVGYPKRPVRVPPRKKLTDIVHMNTYGKAPSIEDPNLLTWEQMASLQSQRIYTTSPEIGFVLTRKKEEQRVIETILEETTPNEDILYLISGPGEFLFPLVQHPKCQSKVVSLELTEATVHWMVQRQKHLEIPSERLELKQWTPESLREHCATSTTIVLYEVLNKLSEKERGELINSIHKHVNPKAKILVIEINPLYRLTNLSFKYTRKAHMGAYEYVKPEYVDGLMTKSGFKRTKWFGIDLFPSLYGIRYGFKRKEGKYPHFAWVTRPLAWVIQWIQGDALEGFKTNGILRKVTKVVGSVYIPGPKDAQPSNSNS